MNNLAIVGRMVADPTLKQTPNGIDVVSFTVAVDRYVKEGEKKADFIPCVAWRSTAIFIARYFKKGQFIGVTGSLQTRQYTDKNDERRTAFEVAVTNACFTEGKKEGNDNKQSQPTELGDFSAVADDSGDLPF